MWQVQERERVVCERHGDRGDRARRDDEHQRPAVQKCRQRTKGLSQVDVAATRAGAPLSQLAPTKRANERDSAAEHPRKQNRLGSAEALGDGGGRAENAATDDATDDGHCSGKEAEAAGVCRHFNDARSPA